MNIKLREMKKGSVQAAKLLRSLASAPRLMILCQLVNGEQNVTALREKSTLSQSAFSQHLAVLRRQKIVTTRKDAQTVYYSIKNDDAVMVLELMYQLFCI